MQKLHGARTIFYAILKSIVGEGVHASLFVEVHKYFASFGSCGGFAMLGKLRTLRGLHV